MALILTLALMQAWQAGATMPTPRFGMAVEAVGDRVFAIGGSESMQRMVPSDAVEAYDVSGDSWVAGFPRLPVPRWYPASAVLDGKVYVMGGTDGRSDHARVDRFDPVARTWDTVAALPWPVEAAAGCVYNGHIYVAGGYSMFEMSGYIPRVLRFVPSPGPGRWDEVDSLEVPRASLGLAVAGGRMHAVAGRYFSNLSSAEYYDGRDWRDLGASLREPRNGLAAVGYDSVIAAIGGSGQGGMMTSVELFNMRTGEWSYGVPLPGPRTYHGAALVHGRIIVVGGRAHMTVVGEVATHDTMMPTGVAEQRPGPTLRPGRQTVLAGPLRVRDETAWEVFDASGELVERGRGPAEVSLARGVWFVRYADGPAPGVTKVTVVR